MARIGALVVMALLVALLGSCEEKTASVQETGLELRFANCITFAAWVWIDGEYRETYTSEQPSFIDVTTGSHTLFVRANIAVADTSYCWSRNFSISEGQITRLTLDCRGAKCQTTGFAGLDPSLEP